MTEPTPQQKWGIRIVALWAGMLTLIALSSLLFLSATMEVFSGQGEVWWVFSLNILFAVSFGLSAYGLWQHHNWGRVLFLWTLLIWSIFGILAFLAPSLIFISARTYANRDLILSLIRSVFGPILALGYLNLPGIKAIFTK